MKKLIAFYIISWIIIILLFVVLCVSFIIFPKLIVLPLGLYLLYLAWSTFYFDKKVKNKNEDFDILAIVQEKDIDKHLK